MKTLSAAAKQQHGLGKNAGRNAVMAAWKGGATGPVGSRFSTQSCRLLSRLSLSKPQRDRGKNAGMDG